jgi:hypothetical protein
MTISPTTPFLRQALLLDAAVSGGTGLFMAALASTLSGLLEFPAALLFWTGVFFLPYAAALVFLATRDELPHWTVRAVIALNALWAIDCIVLAVSGKLEPNTLGVAFLVMQALVVGAFAELQYVALRRIGGAPRYA